MSAERDHTVLSADPLQARCPNCRRECTLLVSSEAWEGRTWAVCFQCETFVVYVAGGGWTFPPPELEPTPVMERDRRWAAMARGHLDRIRKQRRESLGP